MQKIASGQDSTGFNAALNGMQQLEADNQRIANTRQSKDTTSFKAISPPKTEKYRVETNEGTPTSLPLTADLSPETYDSEALRYSAFSAPDQTPYRAMGQLMQPASDKFRTDVVEPIGRQIVSAIRNKQPVNPAEQDLVNIAGKVTQSVGDTYTRESLINATDAIHQGETRHNEAAYRHPPRSDDVLTSLHAADTWGVEETMANPDSNTTKGFENNLRGINLSLQEVRLMGNKLIDPHGRYLDTQGLQQWVDQENAWLNNNKVTELIDFRKIDWRKDPDKFIELGGKYFRESLLGTHLFGYAVDMIKGQGLAGVGEFFGTVAGIARFYNKTDDLMGSILAGGALASADICWDRVVDGLSQHLPPLSRQALLFANSVMSEEVKAQAFEWMKENFNKSRLADKAGKSSSVQGKGVNETGQISDVPDMREGEWPPITIRDTGRRR